MEKNQPEKERSSARQSNFEVLRIVSALLIILFHCSYCSGYGAWLISGFDMNHVVSILLQSWGLVGVHCFFFVSAYFLADSGTIKASKAVELVAETVFYIALMYGGSMLFGVNKSYSLFGGIKELLAYVLDEYWFVGAYLAFYLLVPFLHAAAVNLKPDRILRLIVILLVLMSFMKTFSDIRLFGNVALPILDYFIIVYLKRTKDGRLNCFLQKHAGKMAWMLFTFQCVYNMAFLWLSDRTGSKYADVVTGFSICILLVVVCGVSKDTYIPLLVGHVTLCAPFVYLSVMPKIKQMDPSIYEAALDLGATPAVALRKIVIPQIIPGILSGFGLAVTLSLDDYFIATYTKPATFDTISTYVVNATKGSQTEIKTALWALSTVIFLVVVIIVWLLNVRAGDGAVKKERSHVG